MCGKCGRDEGQFWKCLWVPMEVLFSGILGCQEKILDPNMVLYGLARGAIRVWLVIPMVQRFAFVGCEAGAQC